MRVIGILLFLIGIGRSYGVYRCSPGDLPVVCGRFQCVGEDFFDCTVLCADQGCNSATFMRSTVECQGTYGCYVAEFHKSVVDCSYAGCSASFYESAVDCSGPSSCERASFHRANCCDGLSCPGYLQSCTEDPVAFCSTEYLGATNQQWGNPVCNDIVLMTPSLTVPPSKSPTRSPTKQPTRAPTQQPADRPTWLPSGRPTTRAGTTMPTQRTVPSHIGGPCALE